jgi:molecular chaperone DnaJ
VLTLKGRGMPMLRRTGRTGDLRAVVNVVIPKHLDKHQRKLLKELAGR